MTVNTIPLFLMNCGMKYGTFSTKIVKVTMQKGIGLSGLY
jgi:hypothetical protein